MVIVHSLFYFILAIAILVTFHEFGHFWVARKFKVKVIRFSIGFGKQLFSWQKTPQDTEFVISAIPLGGYVKMVDEREAKVTPEDLPFAFNRKPLFTRTAIVAAGPVFNLMLAVLLFWMVLVIGEDGYRPIIGHITPNSVAAEAGFTEKDEIISVNDKPTPTWMAALDELFSLAVNGSQQIIVEVVDGDNRRQIHQINLTQDDISSPEHLQTRLGLNPWMPEVKPVIGKLIDGGAAQRAGLESGDLILSADGINIKNWQQWVDYVQSKPEVEIKLLIERHDVQIAINIIPNQEEHSGKLIGKIGAGVDVPKDLLENLRVSYSLSPIEALPVAFQKTGFYVLSTLKMIGKMFIGTASVQNLSGPISIAQYAGQSADMGLTAFLKFLGLVSVSLGVLNLLPVPVLDGGHLLFFAVEAIKGSPLSEKMQLFFQQIGMFLLLSLMAFAMFLDLGRLFS